MATRGNKAKKVYILDNGEESKSWKSNAVGLEFQFANGTKDRWNVADFPEEMRVAAEYHGFSQKFGDAYASKETVEDAIEAYEAIKELVMEGDWISDREASGPRLGLLAEAIAAAKTAAGQPDTKEAALARLKANENLRKTAINNKAVAVEYERIKTERQQAKLAEARKAAEGQTVDLSAL